MFYIGHIICFKAQQLRRKETIILSKVEGVAITLDYMMKYEEERAQ